MSAISGVSPTFAYDANGNMTFGPDVTNANLTGTRTVTCDANNMPTRLVHSSLGTSSYTYDGSSSRATKSGPGGVTYYIGEHFEVQGGVEVKYIFAAGRRVAMIKNGTVQYFHKDPLASTAVVTSATGALVEKGSYMPFGVERDVANSGSAYASAISVSSYTYTDQERDSESGLYNYNARLYDPMTGRFLSADSIVPRPGDPQSLNRYSYCLNNPLAYVDPSGHFLVELLTIVGVGALAGGAVSELMGGEFDDGMLYGAIG
ncbi:MAG: RHS repeat-associated core domain-containing protein, partial [Thermodesulfobacteriota bacterium]